MAQNDNEKVENFFVRYQIPIIIAAIVIIAIVLFAVNRGKNTNDENQNDQSSQESGQNSDNNGEVNGEQTPQPTPQPSSGETGSQTGNVTATGTLRNSDNPARGNLMVESNRGKIYIATARDFSSLIDKQVTLNAQGDINSFVFLGFNEAVGPADDRGGSNETPATDVAFTGTLKVSDNMERGNYTITAGGTKVYLQTAHDYSAWLDSEVDLTATGTLASFTNATLSN